LPVYRLTEQLIFPPVEGAEDGILAIGGDLSPERLLLAYSSGIFPWYSEMEPIIWWAPDPRFVLFPEKLKVRKSMAQFIRNTRLQVTFDTAFREVITACAAQKREGQEGTWITGEMAEAYLTLHDDGFAHSVEVWEEGQLVGGLYGVSMGSLFFGESMFHKRSNASKLAFITLVSELEKRDFTMIDCQVETSHLGSLGAELLPRTSFMEKLSGGLIRPTRQGPWTTWLSGTA
jgi:leucyl/phenylalanyl-tRNA--protein transferase